MIRLTGFLLIAGLLITSCSASKMGWSANEADPERKNGQFDEAFDPLTLNDDDIVVKPAETKAETGKPPENSSTILLPSSTELKEVQGFRIQILATKDEAMAREKKRKAMMAFSEKVYLEFEPPYYKLRLGDFRERKEAENFKDQVARIGRRQDEAEWSNAWIVPSKVTVSVISE